jgi:hypothetical protein
MLDAGAVQLSQIERLEAWIAELEQSFCTSQSHCKLSNLLYEA